jgi:hypothetical protein
MDAAGFAENVEAGPLPLLEEFKLLPITSKETVERCVNLKEHEIMNTLFIASYPKSGTTWMQAIVFHILNEGKGLQFDHISDYAPFYEIDQTWENFEQYTRAHERLGWRVFNTHLPWRMMPKGPSMKYIYVVRNGRDVVVSFYHHLSNQVGAAGSLNQSFAEFLNDWCHGRIVFGSWIDHLHSWISACNDPKSNILLMRYEDMKGNLKGSIEKVARFLEVPVSAESIERLESILNFEGMKATKELYQPKSVEWKPDFEFLRKGTW